jgi:putative transposon-encoded protein
MDPLKRESEIGNYSVSNKIKTEVATGETDGSRQKKKVRFEIYGEELIEKVVKSSGNSGRVYLPFDWVGQYVKIIRMD